jgi:hypothetical protein
MGQAAAGRRDDDECVLGSMKGVTSDFAAKAIYQSCLGKFPKESVPNNKSKDVTSAESKAARLVGNGSIDTYLGVHLGMTAQEVTNILGTPMGKVALKSNKEHFSLIWDDAKWVSFDSGSVTTIYCTGHYPIDCPSLAGVEIGDGEAEVIRQLGKPDREDITEDKSQTKIMVFGQSKGNTLHIELQTGKVSRLVVQK